jgi:hypothetical protein
MTVTSLPDALGMLMRVNITRTNSNQYTVISDSVLERSHVHNRPVVTELQRYKYTQHPGK